eukprot:2335793-Karenia_brevis.AAC.1
MSPTFAEGLADLMGCPVERDRLPDDDFLEEARRPPPIYFETDDRTLEGVCCVCFKKRCLGRCPNPGCGLLMHYSCVYPSEPGGDQQ